MCVHGSPRMGGTKGGQCRILRQYTEMCKLSSRSLGEDPDCHGRTGQHLAVGNSLGGQMDRTATRPGLVGAHGGVAVVALGDRRPVYHCGLRLD